MTSTPPSDLRKLSEWDPDALNEAFAAASKDIRDFFRVRLRNVAEADEIVPEACLKVLRSDERVANLQGLLYRAARKGEAVRTGFRPTTGISIGSTSGCEARKITRRKPYDERAVKQVARSWSRNGA